MESYFKNSFILFRLWYFTEPYRWQSSCFPCAWLNAFSTHHWAGFFSFCVTLISCCAASNVPLGASGCQYGEDQVLVDKPPLGSSWHDLQYYDSCLFFEDILRSRITLLLLLLLVLKEFLGAFAQIRHKDVAQMDIKRQNLTPRACLWTNTSAKRQLLFPICSRYLKPHRKIWVSSE